MVVHGSEWWFMVEVVIEAMVVVVIMERYDGVHSWKNTE